MTQVLRYPGHELFAKSIVRADNCDLHDAEGARYVDLESGVWSTPLGQTHPRVIEVLCEQASRIAHAGFNYSSQIVEEAAAEVLSVLGERVLKLLGDRSVPWAQSHQNDPAGAAVVQEVVRTIKDEQLVERSQAIAEKFLTGLQIIEARTGVITEIRERGLMLAIELKDDIGFTLTTRAHRELARKGFLVARRPTAPILRLDPALTIPGRHIASFLMALEEILRVEAERSSQ